jgi:hypothetical protein
MHIIKKMKWAVVQPITRTSSHIYFSPPHFGSGVKNDTQKWWWKFDDPKLIPLMAILHGM